MIRNFILSAIIFSTLTWGAITGVSQPFSSIEIGSSLGNSVLLDDNYSQRWKASNRLSIIGSTPFYIGHLRAYLDFIDYKAVSEATASFNSTNYALGLMHRLTLRQILIMDLGGSFGIQVIAEDAPNVTSDSIERELFYAIILESGIKTKYAIFFASAEYRKIYNYNRQHIFFTGAGIRIRISPPEKIKRFLD